MKRSLHPFRLLAALLLITVSVNAQTSNPLFRHLPPDAIKIYHINLPSLTSKLSWEEIVSNIPPSKSASDQELMQKVLKDPAQAGVDIHQDIFIAQSVGKNKYDSILTILIHLTDSGKFIALLREKEKGLHTFHLPIKGRVIGKDKMTVAWDDKLAVFTIITPASTASQSTAAYTMNAARKSLAALQGFTSSFYTTDPVFTAGFSDDADFHMWGPHGEGAAKLAQIVGKKAAKGGKNPLSMVTQKNKLHTLTAVRFDAGKITMRTTTKVPPDSAKNYKILTSRPLNTDLINRLPGKAVLGMVNIHFDPSLLPEYLEKYHLLKMLDSMLSSKGLTTSDVLKAFKGDFLIAGMQPVTQPDSVAGKLNPAIYFVTTIGDINAFMKLAGKLNLGSDSTRGLFGKMKSAYTIKDNTLVVGRNKAATDGYFSNTSARSSDLVSDRVRTNAFSLAVDLKAITAFIQSADNSSSPKTQQMLHFLTALDRLTYTAGGFQNDQLESYFELKMADASENSLRTIFKLLH